MNSRQVIVWGGLLVLLAVARQGCAQAAGLAPAAEAQAAGAGPGVKGRGDLGAIREWLDRRNQERKKLGLPGADLPKTHAAALPPRWRRGQELQAKSGPGQEAGPQPGAPAAQPIVRGPDGRIRVRYVLREDGPDQLQVYSGEGYSAPVPLGDEGQAIDKLARLTPRGKQVWMAGSALRAPSANRGKK